MCSVHPGLAKDGIIGAVDSYKMSELVSDLYVRASTFGSSQLQPVTGGGASTIYLSRDLVNT